MLDVARRPIHAAIDVGSKSIRLLVARQLSLEAFEVVDEDRLDARLGEGQQGGELTADAIERGVRALRILTQVARAYGPARVDAVGTEALRSAPNAAQFIERVFDETGVRVRILSANQEAFASFLGVVNSSSLDSGYIVDIGGGSLELIRVEDRRFADSVSVPFGSIYASERFFRSDPPTAKEVRSLRRAVRDHLSPAKPGEHLHGAGGAIRNLGRMTRINRGYPLSRLHGFAVTRSDLRRVTRALLAAPAVDRRRLAGINVDRVATLPAAAVVIEEVMDLVGAPSMVVSGQALREGLLWQVIRGDSPVLSDVRLSSVAGLAAANSVDVLAAEPEVSVASRLFDATVGVHGLEAADRELLVHAARLAEIGMHVDFYNRDRHAEYLIHAGDLRGFSHREIVLLAAIVRWSMSGTPDLSAYRRIIDAGDERRVQVLAALLGVARATWRRTPSPVSSVTPAFSGKALSFRLEARGGADAEQHALERQLKRLESVLRIKVSLETALRG